MSEPLSVADALDRAADLIEPEGAWSNDDVARDNRGEMTFAGDPAAVCWCALGAIWRVTAEAGVGRYPVEAAFNKVIDGGSIAEFNDADGRTQAEVVAKLREAADLARARPAEFGNIGADGVQS